MTQEEEKFKEFSCLNDHYLKISVTSQSLTLMGLNINKLDNILYVFSLTPEEIKQNDKYKNLSLNDLYEKIINLIEKKKYLISGDKNCIVLTIYEGEHFDIGKDLQFFLIKSNDTNNPNYENALKKIIMSLKKENITIKNELNDFKLDKKVKSESLSFTKLAEKTDKFISNPKLAATIQPNSPNPIATNTNIEQNDKKDKKQNLSVSENTANRNKKRRSTYGLTISRLSKLDYDMYYISLYLEDPKLFKKRLDRGSHHNYQAFSLENSKNQQDVYKEVAKEISEFKSIKVIELPMDNFDESYEKIKKLFGIKD